MKKLITAVLGGTAVASLAFASASVLTVDGGVMQTGVDDSLSCQEGDVKLSWGLETDDSAVYFVDVSNISDECIGGEIAVRGNNMSYALGGDIVDNKPVRLHVPDNKAPIDVATLTSVQVWIGK